MPVFMPVPYAVLKISANVNTLIFVQIFRGYDLFFLQKFCFEMRMYAILFYKYETMQIARTEEDINVAILPVPGI